MQQRQVAPQVNRLLSRLGVSDRDLLLAGSRIEWVNQGYRISSCQDGPGEVCFPLSAVVTLNVSDNEGRMAQTAIIGREGCVGLRSVFSDRPANGEAVVLISGEVLVVQAAQVRSLMDVIPPIRSVMNEALCELCAQALQLVACNHLHGLEQRGCRTLLMLHDRSHEDELPITQESLATLLGSGRPRVNGLLARLEAQGLVRRHRGRIRLLSRTRLEHAACECYQVTQVPRLQEAAD